MSGHTPEPWRARKITSSNGQYLLTDGEKHIALVPRENDARRIVACVNACQGIPTEHLEGTHRENADYWGKVATDRDNYKVQRDELLAALKLLTDETSVDTDCVFDPKESFLKAHENARAVIAKIKEAL